MAWEKRRGRTYFYLSKKLPDGRVGKQYYGQGLLAEIDSIRLDKLHADRLMLKQLKARFFAADLRKRGWNLRFDDRSMSQVRPHCSGEPTS